jgi:hypothetical protein
MDSEIVTTRVDVVLKSENTKYAILSVLKKHFLFKQGEIEDFAVKIATDHLDITKISSWLKAHII